MPQRITFFVYLCGMLSLLQSTAIWLDVPFFKQEKDGCGAAVIAMVIEYWNQKQPQPRAATLADPIQIQKALYSSEAHGESNISSQAGSLWSSPGESFEKVQAGVDIHWLPQARGDNFETRVRVRSGTTFGDIPFDELWMLGLERDNDLWLRGHIGTRDGRKGSAPLGKDYFLRIGIRTEMFFPMASSL